MSQSVVQPLQDAGDTRQRLLDAAGEVFAELGFHKATIRDICQRAGANIAAVNYHFGDKAGLYLEVLRYSHRCAIEKYPPMGPADVAGVASMAAADRLRLFVTAFLSRMLDEGRPAWHGKLMAREMAEPTAALDTLVEETVRPNYGLISGIVRELLGPDADESTIRRCSLSIIGQCVFLHFARPVISRVLPHQRFDANAVAQFAEHITRFSLGGLRATAGEKEQRT